MDQTNVGFFISTLIGTLIFGFMTTTFLYLTNTFIIVENAYLLLNS